MIDKDLLCRVFGGIKSFSFVVLIFSAAQLVAQPVVQQKLITLPYPETSNWAGLYEIRGHWRFYPEKHHSPVEALADTSFSRIDAGGRHNGKLERLGYGTYLAELVLPSYRSQLAIYFPYISSASKIWINNTLVLEKGILGNTSGVHKGNADYILLALPDSIVNPLITIQVSNFSSSRMGILGKPLVGEISLLSRHIIPHTALGNIFLGAFLCIGVIHLFLYSLFRRQKDYLYLALICLLLAIRTLVVHRGILTFPALFSHLELEYLRKAEYISVYAILIVLPLYINSTFRIKINYWFVNVMCTLGLGFSIYVLFGSVQFYAGLLLQIAHVLFLIEFAYAFYIFYLNRKKSNAKIIVGGLLLSFPLIFLQILQDSKLVEVRLEFLLEIGVLIFFLFQSYLLAKRNARTFQIVENLNASLEEEVGKRTEELTKTNLIKDSLLSVISHDLRSPINNLKGIISLYNAHHVKPEELKPIMKRMEADLNITDLLLSNILKWSSAQVKGLTVRKAPVALYSIVTETFDLFKQQAKLKRIAVEYTQCSQSCYVNADEDILRLTLRNLLSNALKFTTRGGLIRIYTTIKEDVVFLTIRDNGIGIHPKQLQEMFTSRVGHQKGTEEERGHGIGLSLCKQYLNKMGAEIWVESNLGAGTTFTVMLEKTKKKQPAVFGELMEKLKNKEAQI